MQLPCTYYVDKAARTLTLTHTDREGGRVSGQIHADRQKVHDTSPNSEDQRDMLRYRQPELNNLKRQAPLGHREGSSLQAHVRSNGFGCAACCSLSITLLTAFPLLCFRFRLKCKHYITNSQQQQRYMMLLISITMMVLTIHLTVTTICLSQRSRLIVEVLLLTFQMYIQASFGCLVPELQPLSCSFTSFSS